MADGWTYSQWVVGNSRMRAVDPDWPAPGSRICHSVGVWPMLLDDVTVVEESVPLEKLVLHAKGRPFGGARVILHLSDIDDGCRVEMTEYPVTGPPRCCRTGFRTPRRGRATGRPCGGWPRWPNTSSRVSSDRIPVADILVADEVPGRHHALTLDVDLAAGFEHEPVADAFVDVVRDLDPARDVGGLHA